MKLGVKIFWTIAVSALAMISFVGIKQFVFSQETPVEAPHREKRIPGIVNFDPDAPQLSFLKVAPVNEVPMPVAEPINGRITYNENVTSRVSSPVLGRVIGLHAEVGDRVKHNQSLLDIDSPDLATAEADWRKGVADEVRKKLGFERSKNLFEHQVIARKDYESAEADYRQAVAETRRASLRMKNLNASGNENGKFGLKAPIAGIIADKKVNPGMEVRPDQPDPLFVITELNRLWVMADVPEKSISKIKHGQTVSIETDAYPDERFQAQVDQIGLALDPNTRRIQVRCTIQNTDNKLKPEMFARVYFMADGEKKAIEVPNGSLIADGIYSYVFVEKQAGVFEKRRVNVALKGRDNSFIDSGLSNGDRVVTEGVLLLNSEASGNAQ